MPLLCRTTAGQHMHTPSCAAKLVVDRGKVRGLQMPLHLNVFSVGGQGALHLSCAELGILFGPDNETSKPVMMDGLMRSLEVVVWPLPTAWLQMTCAHHTPTPPKGSAQALQHVGDGVGR